MVQLSKDIMLFRGIPGDKLDSCLQCAGARVKQYSKGQQIFCLGDRPEYVYVLLTGGVAVYRDYPDGKRNIIANIQAKDIFGEVFVFLKGVEYNSSAMALVDSFILCVPKEFFYSTCPNCCEGHSRFIRNMLEILSTKTFALHSKLTLLASGSLRQKLARYILEGMDARGYMDLSMNREELAMFLNVTRPSLSRELLKMQAEGLIEVYKSSVKVLDSAGLSDAI